jgi:hypothetical protein
VGVGDSLEAAFTLRRAVPAGTWRLVGDGIMVGEGAEDIDVRFEIVWRPQETPATGGMVLASFENRFVRDAVNRFQAIPYTATATGMAAAGARPGDLLVLRVVPLRGIPDARYIPNGDGKLAKGEIPHIDLPQ